MKKNLNRIALALFISILSSVCFGEAISTSIEIAQSHKMMSFIKTNQIPILLELGIAQERSDLEYAKKYPQTSAGKPDPSECNSARQIKLARIDVLSKIVFNDGETYPTQGVWRLVYTLTGCGRTPSNSAIATAHPNSAPTVSPSYRGNSVTKPELIESSLPTVLSAINAAKNRSQDCNDIGLANTKLTTPFQDLISDGQNYKNSWQEVWSFHYCGQTNNVLITFTPNSSTGATRVDAKPMANDELINLAKPSVWTAFAALIQKSGQPSCCLECSEVNVSNSNLMPVVNTKKTLENKSWTEIWKVFTCRRIGEVVVTFTEVKDGDTRIAVKAKSLEAFSLIKSCTPPSYPAISKRLEEEGTTKIQIKVSPTGEPLETKVIQSSGYDRLDKAVLAFGKICSFLPATDEQGHAVIGDMEWSFEFALN